MLAVTDLVVQTQRLIWGSMLWQGRTVEERPKESATPDLTRSLKQHYFKYCTSSVDNDNDDDHKLLTKQVHVTLLINLSSVLLYGSRSRT